MDDDERWLFHQWFKELVRSGKAVAFQPGPSGDPAGYREKEIGQWSKELTGNQEIARAEPSFVVERLKELEFEAGAAEVVGILQRFPSWLGPLVQALIEDGDHGVGPLAALSPEVRAKVEVLGRADPVWLRAVIFGEALGAGGGVGEEPELSEDEIAVLRLMMFKLALERADPPDYDPVRDAGRLQDARRYLLALAAFLRGGGVVKEDEDEGEGDDLDLLDYWRRRLLAVLSFRALVLSLSRVPGDVPLKPSKPGKPVKPREVVILRHEDPILSQTRRRVRERSAGGKFTGRVEVRTVPTMRIDLESYLGSLIRIVDDDTGRKDPPRGALAVIKTGSGRSEHRQWIMPIRWINGRLSWRGKERDDPRRAKLRAEQGAEVIQLTDHRTGVKRKIEVLASPSSQYFSVAMEFAAEFERLSGKV